MITFVHSSAWLKVKRQLLLDRGDLVEQLIAQADHDASQKVRGKIEQIDEILARYPVELGQREDDD